MTGTELAVASRSSGPTVRLLTRLSEQPEGGRDLYFAVGENAEALTGAVRTYLHPNADRLFEAEVPAALVMKLEDAGIVQRATVVIGDVKGTEMFIRRDVVDYFLKFMRELTSSGENE